MLFAQDVARLSVTRGTTGLPVGLHLTGIFFLNFLGRVVLAPLMPYVERDLNVGHGEAGSLFLFGSLGYFAGLLGSGFLSSRSTHRRTIILFPLGIMLVGLLLMGGIILVQYLKFHEEAIQTIA